jgi:hypothetical protein
MLSSEANNLNIQSRNSPPFIEPEGSLQYSKDPATLPYPEKDETSPHIPI